MMIKITIMIRSQQLNPKIRNLFNFNKKQSDEIKGNGQLQKRKALNLRELNNNHI